MLGQVMSDEAAIVEQKETGLRVFIALPHNHRMVDFAASTAFYHPIKKESKIRVSMNDAGGPEVLCNHNVLWSMAIDRYEAGEIDAFALIHADIGAEPGWLDVLNEEREKVGADVISAVVPIKDDRGLTSTSVDDTGDDWLWRRLTFTNIHAMPKTFTDADVGGPLCLNTGLMLVKFGPWCLKESSPGYLDIRFRFEHAIRKESNGKRRVLFKPDDWLLSRQFREAGLKLAATRQVCLNHCGGDFQWNNQAEPYGWPEDIQNGPNAPHKIAEAKGFTLDAPLADSKAKLDSTGEIKTIKNAKQTPEGVFLVFDDGTEANMKECTAVVTAA